MTDQGNAEPIRAVVDIEVRDGCAEIEIPADEWVKMTPRQRRDTLDEMALAEVNNAGGWGVTLLDPEREADLVDRPGDPKPPPARLEPVELAGWRYYIHGCGNVEAWPTSAEYVAAEGTIDEQGCDSCDCAPDGGWRLLYTEPR
jgi:hypothetical protein